MILPRGLWACDDCGTMAVADGLTVCPHCGKKRKMPKVSSADNLVTDLIDPNTGEMDGVRAPVHGEQPKLNEPEEPVKVPAKRGTGRAAASGKVTTRNTKAG